MLNFAPTRSVKIQVQSIRGWGGGNLSPRLPPSCMPVHTRWPVEVNLIGKRQGRRGEKLPLTQSVKIRATKHHYELWMAGQMWIKERDAAF